MELYRKIMKGMQGIEPRKFTNCIRYGVQGCAVKYVMYTVLEIVGR
jgi:hypothetical protein